MSTFKALVYDNKFVNELKLSKGIQEVESPILHSETETLETLKKKLDLVIDTMPDIFIKETFHKNFDKCQLKVIKLK